jgi:FAD/FMN-containing dehydrogenase
MSDTEASPGQGARIVWRGDPGYEQVHRSMLWNQLTPDRFPEVIAAATSEQDVIEAVRLARARGLRVAVRAGGHSWCGSPLREGSLLIDLSRLTEFSIDVASRTAGLQPNVTSRAFALALAAHGLAFRVGHCGPVGLSGFLLSEGLGWNGGAWGPACASIEEIEVVTADGVLVRANERENPDLFWAARGAGPGFFGVVTQYRVRLQSLPRAITSSTYMYPLACVDQVAGWASQLAATLPPVLELTVVLTAAPPPVAPGEKLVMVSATAFADSPRQARELLAAADTCPILERAVARQVCQPTPWESLFDSFGALWPEQHRYAADTLWSGEDFTAVLPGLAEHFAAAPSGKSLVLAVMGSDAPEGPQLPDMSFSMSGRLFLACYAVWQDPARDADNIAWLRRAMAAVEPWGIGHYVAETDLPAAPTRAARSFAPPHWQRLTRLRRQFDPAGLFHTYLGLPETS